MSQGSALRGEAVFFPQHLSPDVHDQLIHNAVLQDRSKFAISQTEAAMKGDWSVLYRRPVWNVIGNRLETGYVKRP